MSIITFQFGQCGNQVGQCLYSYIFEDTFYKSSHHFVDHDYIEHAKNTWFNINKKGDFIARSILVDTEKKVTAAANKNTCFTFANIISGAYGGSANNWACGYNCKSRLLIGEILETTRKEVEKSDFISSFVNILSPGGGTGSGVGSHTIERIRDEFPSKTIINCLILPHEGGEVVTQNYNTVLTLAKLYDISDSLILFCNDFLSKVCARSLYLKDVTLKNLNEVIAWYLAGVFQPLQNAKMVQLMADLVNHPSYKLMSIQTVPLIPKEHLNYESKFSWQMLISQLERSLKQSYMEMSAVNKQNASDSKTSFKSLISNLKCIANVFITRGERYFEANNKFLKEQSYVPWVPKESHLSLFHHSRPLKDLELSTTLISNNNTCTLPLNSIIEDAWILFTNGAYLHHYKKFEVEEPQFLEAFEKLENILLNYHTLVSYSWTIEQKQKLLIALKKFGTNDIFAIAEEIPGKSISEIRLMIKKYERLAMQTLEPDENCEKLASLDQWIETIRWTSNHPLNISHISKALKYIALFEDHHRSSVNLRDCYEVLSDMTAGVVPKAISEETAYFLRKCISELAQKVTNQNTDAEVEFLENFRPESLEYSKTYGKRKAEETNGVMDPLINNLLVPSKILKK